MLEVTFILVMFFSNAVTFEIYFEDVKTMIAFDDERTLSNLVKVEGFFKILELGVFLRVPEHIVFLLFTRF